MNGFKNKWPSHNERIIQDAAVLIQKMIQFKPEDRIASIEIMKDKFFFSHDVYDIYNQELRPGLALIFSQEKFQIKVIQLFHSCSKIFIVQACRDPKIRVTETASKNYRIISCSKITINVLFVSERGFNRCT